MRRMLSMGIAIVLLATSTGCGMLIVAAKEAKQKQRREKEQQKTIEKRRDQIREYGDDRLLSDYNQLVKIEEKTSRRDEKRYERLRRAFDCVKGYLFSRKDEQTDADLEENLDNYDGCRSTCSELASAGSQSLHRIAATYRTRCDEKHRVWADKKRRRLKEKYRESLAAYAEAVPEQKWPMFAHRKFRKLEMLVDSVEKEWGDDDPLAVEYRKRLDSLEKGPTGRKIERFREFLDREEIGRLHEKLARARIAARDAAGRADTARLKLEDPISAQHAEWSRQDLRRSKADLREAEARIRTYRNRIAREAIDADLAPADVQYRGTVSVAPGDEPVSL